MDSSDSPTALVLVVCVHIRIVVLVDVMVDVVDVVDVIANYVVLLDVVAVETQGGSFSISVGVA